jgi:hypothetical protein
MSVVGEREREGEGRSAESGRNEKHETLDQISLEKNRF